MSQTRYEVVLSPRAKRAIERDLPEAVAFAVVAFRYGPRAEDPYRIGKPLSAPWALTAPRRPFPSSPLASPALRRSLVQYNTTLRPGRSTSRGGGPLAGGVPAEQSDDSGDATCPEW